MRREVMTHPYIFPKPKNKPMKTQLKITKTETATIIKRGRKKFAEITYNKNPDYKFCVWHNRVCFSGYETEERALEKVFRLNEDWQNLIDHIGRIVNTH